MNKMDQERVTAAAVLPNSTGDSHKSQENHRSVVCAAQQSLQEYKASVDVTNQEIELHRKYLQNIQKKKRYTQLIDLKSKERQENGTKLPLVNGSSLNNALQNEPSSLASSGKGQIQNTRVFATNLLGPEQKPLQPQNLLISTTADSSAKIPTQFTNNNPNSDAFVHRKSRDNVLLPQRRDEMNGTAMSSSSHGAKSRRKHKKNMNMNPNVPMPVQNNMVNVNNLQQQQLGSGQQQKRFNSKNDLKLAASVYFSANPQAASQMVQQIQTNNQTTYSQPISGDPRRSSHHDMSGTIMRTTQTNQSGQPAKKVKYRNSSRQSANSKNSMRPISRQQTGPSGSNSNHTQAQYFPAVQSKVRIEGNDHVPSVLRGQQRKNPQYLGQGSTTKVIKKGDMTAMDHPKIERGGSKMHNGNIPKAGSVRGHNTIPPGNKEKANMLSGANFTPVQKKVVDQHIMSQAPPIIEITQRSLEMKDVRDRMYNNQGQGPTMFWANEVLGVPNNTHSERPPPFSRVQDAASIVKMKTSTESIGAGSGPPHDRYVPSEYGIVGNGNTKYINSSEVIPFTQMTSLSGRGPKKESAYYEETRSFSKNVIIANSDDISQVSVSKMGNTINDREYADRCNQNSQNSQNILPPMHNTIQANSLTNQGAMDFNVAQRSTSIDFLENRIDVNNDIKKNKGANHQESLSAPAPITSDDGLVKRQGSEHTSNQVSPTPQTFKQNDSKRKMIGVNKQQAGDSIQNKNYAVELSVLKNAGFLAQTEATQQLLSSMKKAENRTGDIIKRNEFQSALNKQQRTSIGKTVKDHMQFDAGSKGSRTVMSDERRIVTPPRRIEPIQDSIKMTNDNQIPRLDRSATESVDLNAGSGEISCGGASPKLREISPKPIIKNARQFLSFQQKDQAPSINDDNTPTLMFAANGTINTGVFPGKQIAHRVSSECVHKMQQAHPSQLSQINLANNNTPKPSPGQAIIPRDMETMIARSQHKQIKKQQEAMSASMKKKGMKARGTRIMAIGNKMPYQGLLQSDILNDMTTSQQKLFKVQVEKATKFELERRQRMREVAQGKNAPLIGVKGFHVSPQIGDSPSKESKKTPVKLEDFLNKSPTRQPTLHFDSYTYDNYQSIGSQFDNKSHPKDAVFEKSVAPRMQVVEFPVPATNYEAEFLRAPIPPNMQNKQVLKTKTIRPPSPQEDKYVDAPNNNSQRESTLNTQRQNAAKHQAGCVHKKNNPSTTAVSNAGQNNNNEKLINMGQTQTSSVLTASQSFPQKSVFATQRKSQHVGQPYSQKQRGPFIHNSNAVREQARVSTTNLDGIKQVSSRKQSATVATCAKHYSGSSFLNRHNSTNEVMIAKDTSREEHFSSSPVRERTVLLQQKTIAALPEPEHKYLQVEKALSLSMKKNQEAKERDHEQNSPPEIKDAMEHLPLDKQISCGAGHLAELQRSVQRLVESEEEIEIIKQEQNSKSPVKLIPPNIHTQIANNIERILDRELSLNHELENLKIQRHQVQKECTDKHTFTQQVAYMKQEAMTADQLNFQSQIIKMNGGQLGPASSQFVVNPDVMARQRMEALAVKKLDALEKARNYSKLNKGVSKYKYSIISGNNSTLLRRLMALRTERWEECNHFDKLYNFKWQPTSRGTNFNLNNSMGTRQLVNHIANHALLSTKHQLFEHMYCYCEQNKIDAFKYLPITFVLSSDSVYFKEEIEKFANYFAGIQLEMVRNYGDVAAALHAVNLKYTKLKVQLPHKNAMIDARGRLLKQTSNIHIPQSYFSGHNMWILKVTGQNKGIGIHVFNQLKDLAFYIRKYTAYLPKNDQLVHGLSQVDKQAAEMLSDKFLASTYKSPVNDKVKSTPKKKSKKSPQKERKSASAKKSGKKVGKQSEEKQKQEDQEFESLIQLELTETISNVEPIAAEETQIANPEEEKVDMDQNLDKVVVPKAEAKEPLEEEEAITVQKPPAEEQKKPFSQASERRAFEAEAADEQATKQQPADRPTQIMSPPKQVELITPILQDGEKKTKSGSASNNVKSSSFVIQKYMEDPLLINGRKFDIRVWVLVSQNGSCYLFKEGYIRTSCEVYDTSNAKNITRPEIHLTNNAIQKNAANYGKFEDGNQMTFNQLQEYMTATRTDNPDIVDYVHGRLYKAMKEQIIISLEAMRSLLKVEKGCFEVYGYDFLVDDSLDTWIVEVNTNPSLDESSGFLKGLLARMVNDALRLTIDVVFGQKKGMAPYNREELNQFPVEGYELSENMWELVTQLSIFKRQPDGNLALHHPN